MSVINKMLRDLDRRADAEAGSEPAQLQPRQVPLMQGTASVGGLPARRAAATRTPRLALLLSALVACLAALAWWLARPLDRTPPTDHASAVRPRQPLAAAPPQTTPQPAPAPSAGSAAAAAPAALSDPARVTALGTPPAEPAAHASNSLPVRRADTAVAASVPAARSTRPPVAPPAAAQVAVALAGSGTPTAAPAQRAARMPQAPARTASTASTTDMVAPLASPVAAKAAQANAPAGPLQWQDAALDALAQAQRLWASGSREAAVDLLQEAVAALERSQAAQLALPGAAVPLALVRQLVHMQATLGQSAQVVELLRRHERLVAGSADLWAVRGNAAQRLGQHAESVLSYRTALRVRPGEPRWMLGAAVSLAALGQIAPAAELAEQAMALDAASPEVLAYLRQLGVPLRER